MPQATPDKPDDDVDALNQLIREAGNPDIQPAADHVAKVRSLMLERLDQNQRPVRLPQPV